MSSGIRCGGGGDGGGGQTGTLKNRADLYLEIHNSDVTTNVTATKSQMDGEKFSPGGGLNDNEWRAKKVDFPSARAVWRS